MKKWNVMAYTPIVLFLFISLFFAIMATIQWKEKRDRDRKFFVADSVERMDNKKWIIDTIIKKESSYPNDLTLNVEYRVYAHNKSFPKMKAGFSLYKEPTFSAKDTIVDLIK
jgi:hypothetical protein